MKWNHTIRSRVRAALAALPLMLMLLPPLTGCGGNDPEPPPAIEGSATLDAAGGTVNGPDGVRIVLPAGALASTTTVRIARDSTGAPALSQAPLSPIYTITPHIAMLGVPATVSVPIDTSKLDPAAPPPQVWVAQPGGAWEPLPTGAVQGGVVSAPTFHFSYLTVVQVPVRFVSAQVELPVLLPGWPGSSFDPPYLQTRAPISGTVRLTLSGAAFDDQLGRMYCRTPMNIVMSVNIVDALGHWGGARETVLGPFDAAATASFNFSIDASANGYYVIGLRESCVLTLPAGHSGGIGPEFRYWGAVATFKVDIGAPPGAPVISLQPQAASTTVGQPAGFGITAAGSGTVTIEWFRSNDGGATWADTGKAGPTINLPTTAAGDDGSVWRARVCNSDGLQQTCIDSAPASLEVMPLPASPTASITPATQSVVAGQTASVTATATGVPKPNLAIVRVGTGGGADTVVINCGATRPCAYTTPPLTTADDGAQFYAQAVTPGHNPGDAGYSANSTPARVAVTANSVPPAITAQPVAAVAPVGGGANFSVAATGTTPLSYQWWFKGAPLVDRTAGATTSGVAGSGSPALGITNAQLSDAGAYRVVVSNGTPPDATSDTAILTVQPTAFLALAGGGAHTCALLSGGIAACWGSNDSGQLGDGSTTIRLAPTIVPGLSRVVAVAAGSLHSCAVRDNGSVACWGMNDSGQIGDGRTFFDSTTTPFDVPGQGGVVAVAAGVAHTCVLKYTGGVTCWGSNRYGVLGDGGVAVGSAPIDVPGLTGVTELKAGRFHTCAVKNDGTLWCWGLNQTGQIGDGTVADRSRPTRVSGLADVVAVAPGANHTCAARSDGTVACWGSNNFGQLGKGIGQSTPTLVPAAVPQFTGALNLVAGAFHTCALRRVLFSLDPPASCWGDSSSGQLGAPSTTVFGPVSPSITDITSLAAGDGHSCAVKGDGTAVCWGLNNHGQLGDGTTVNKDRPTPVI